MKGVSQIPLFVHHVLLFAALFSLSCLKVSSSPESEKEILLQFKGNVTDDPYNSLSSWVSSKNPCENYVGISCNSEGFVEKIVLWNTSLAGVLSPALSRLELLKVLTLYGNHFSGRIPEEYAEFQSLWKINLSSNALSGPIPDFIGNIKSLHFLDLSLNGFSGDIPSALLKYCYKTKFLSLSHNNLSGSIPASIVNCLNLEGFDISFNNLTGNIPPRLCDIPRLSYVSLKNNALSGTEQDQIFSECHSLVYINLASNMFSGSAPFNILEMKNLTYFNISYNEFSGHIPEMSSCSERLEFLDASGNDLEGEIPMSITRCKKLKLLALEVNRLIGTIPLGIQELKSLLVVKLDDNSIGGTIPKGFGNIELLEILDLHNLNLTGEIPNDVSNCRFLLELNFSGNNLEGEIPQTLYNLTNLESLDLHQNKLSGSIPPSLGNSTTIRHLDLSHNLLSGSIPSSLGNLRYLMYFNLSFNNLSGVIPPIATIQGFGSSAFSKNPFLCGSPLDDNTSCSGNATNYSPSASGKTKMLSVSTIVAIVAAAFILAGVFLVIILNTKTRNKKKEEDHQTMIVESTPLGSTESSVVIGKLVLFNKSLPSKYENWETGTKALLDKEYLIGAGSIGTVYRTNLEDGISVAVKKLETLGTIRSQQEFQHEIVRLGNLKHPNLVSFQGYYWSTTMKMILSEFVPNGNLYDNLHVKSEHLDWSRRLQIALGTAKALAYLHHDCEPPILHLNLKSSNILLDNKYEAKLSDYGLNKLLPINNYYGGTRFHNSVGYIAPELATSLRTCTKCDVYSFGVILLELVTGKKPVESSVAAAENGGVVGLCELVRILLESGSASDCLDRKLIGGVAESEFIQVMRMGLICTSEDPSRRPTMAEIVQFLESIEIASESR